MNTLDITIDFETCALCPTAAVMSVGAVAWDRMASASPFLDGSEFYRHVDLRSSFLDGFTFDPATAHWWAQQSQQAREAVLEPDPTPIVCLQEVISQLCEWIVDMKHLHEAADVFLWSQGSDFDIAILRNISNKYDIRIPVNYTNFRDHRTFFLEGAHTICDFSHEVFDVRNAYKMVDSYDGQSKPHDPIFDCRRSIYSTWQMMQHLRVLPKN